MGHVSTKPKDFYLHIFLDRLLPCEHFLRQKMAKALGLGGFVFQSS